MDNELESLDSQNQQIEDIGENDDLDALKEKYQKATDLYKSTFDRNKQLFERTKKAETELKELRFTKETEQKKSKKSDEFGLLEKAFLGSRGVIAQDEIELFRKWSDDTKKSIDELVDHPFVKAELETLRTTKANQTATSNIKGESNASTAKDDPDYWIAKMDDQRRFPDDLPQDYKLRAKIMERLLEKSQTGKQFYND